MMIGQMWTLLVIKQAGIPPSSYEFGGALG